MLGKICREYQKMSRDELREMLRRESEVILPALAELSGDGRREFLFFVLTACSDKGKIDIDEFSLLTEASGIEIEYPAACELIAIADTRKGKNEIDAALDMFALLDGNIKASMISFCLCVCAANGKITRKEKKFLKRLMK